MKKNKSFKILVYRFNFNKNKFLQQPHDRTIVLQTSSSIRISITLRMTKAISFHKEHS